MTRYKEYKDSGEQWLGEIPSHWGLRKMKYTFSERSQKGFPNEPLLAATQNHGVIKKSDYENRTVEATKNLDTLKLVEKGDFVISLRSFQGGIEYSYCRGIISPAYTVLKAHHLTEPYFKHLAKSPIFINLLKSTVTGIREGQNIDYNKLKVEFMPIPTLEEQQAIADYLDTATAKIDEAIAQQQKMIDLLNERKQIIINNAVTKGLNPDAPMKDSGVDWIGEIPEHWEVMPLKRCCELVREKCIKTANFRVALENIESWSGTYIDTTSEYDGIGVQFKKGDILFGKLRPYLAKVYLAEKDGEALGDIWILRSKSSCFSGYIHKILLSKKIIDVIDSSTYGTKMPRADWGTNSKLCIPVPPFSEQETITSFLDTISFNIECAISNATKQISLLQERKQIIINDVVTGKVKVTK